MVCRCQRWDGVSKSTNLATFFVTVSVMSSIETIGTCDVISAADVYQEHTSDGRAIRKIFRKMVFENMSF